MKPVGMYVDVPDLSLQLGGFLNDFGCGEIYIRFPRGHGGLLAAFDPILMILTADGG